MKKTVFFIFLLVISLCSSAQSAIKSYGTKVHIIDWEKRGLVFSENFFDETKDSIVAQIGEDEFRKVRKYCGVLSWPEAIQGKIMTRKDSTIKINFFKKLDSLNVYRIATYQHYFQGKRKARFCIIRVPYNDNISWDKSAIWDTVYFIVRETAVQSLTFRD